MGMAALDLIPHEVVGCAFLVDYRMLVEVMVVAALP